MTVLRRYYSVLLMSTVCLVFFVAGCNDGPTGISTNDTYPSIKLQEDQASEDRTPPQWPEFLRLGEVAIWTDSRANIWVIEVEILAEEEDTVTIRIASWLSGVAQGEEVITCHRRMVPVAMLEVRAAMDRDHDWIKVQPIDEETTEQWETSIFHGEVLVYTLSVYMNQEGPPDLSTFNGSSGWFLLSGQYLVKYNEEDGRVHAVPNADKIRSQAGPFDLEYDPSDPYYGPGDDY